MNERDTQRRSRVQVLAVAAGALLAVGLVAIVLVSSGESPPSSRPRSTTPGPRTPPAPSPTNGNSAPLGPPGRPAPAGEQLGVNVNHLFDDQFSHHGYSPRQIDTQLKALRRTGATVARTDALWEASEPAAPVGGVHSYAWSFDDSIVGSLAAHGLRLLPIIDYSAPWAQSLPGQDHSPPRSPDDYAAYAGALAARYGERGSFWRSHPKLTPEPVDTYEIWNEPDYGGFWVPNPNASRYVELYLRARAAITAVQPAARVIVGGLSTATTFLPAMLASRPDLAAHLDGVAIHPYGAKPHAVLDMVRAVRQALAALGMPAVPLYVTEFGWTTNPRGAKYWVPRRVRPGYIARTISDLAHSDCGVVAAILYTWVTAARNRNDLEQWFGIHSTDARRYADTKGFATGVRDASRASRPLGLCSGIT